MDEEPSLRLKSFSGEEKELLEEFNNLLNTHYDRLDDHHLCGHNIKEFDVPFLCRRSVIHGLDLPRLLNISGKKPWQVSHLLDTMELWRFGDYKNYTSLALLAGTLGIPSPKDDIDGSMVGHVYWQEDDIERIITYCEKDVITVAQVVMKFAGMDLIREDQIEVV
jgi:DNA polymerase elongation subunit (family B)